jgi:hypothetical protein
MKDKVILYTKGNLFMDLSIEEFFQKGQNFAFKEKSLKNAGIKSGELRVDVFKYPESALNAK